MKVYLNRIDGIDDALVSLLMTNKKWTRSKEEHIRSMVQLVNTPIGKYATPKGMSEIIVKAQDEYNDKFKRLLNFAKKHITLGEFIDFSCTVEGLHRAGQDDFDSHSKRFDNRIIRMSTRTNSDIYEKSEYSDYYKDKIISLDDALESIKLDPPMKIKRDGKTYIKTVNGYILESEKDNPDVKRGLYMLSIPSNFIFRCNLTQFAHVYKQRGEHGHANPEVKQLAEEIAKQLNVFQPLITREYLMEAEN